MCFFLEFPNVRPFVIAIWCGEGKPLVNEYLRDFVDELNALLETGVSINNFILEIKVKCFICDTPARAYIKGVFFCVFYLIQADKKTYFRHCASYISGRLSKMYYYRRILFTFSSNEFS